MTIDLKENLHFFKNMGFVLVVLKLDLGMAFENMYWGGLLFKKENREGLIYFSWKLWKILGK
jgi:hypothetical protein